ncbi:hypothetical protein GO013_16120 [Pseudodesulfovibrio sp. JC047]|uniref:hypothetical protein n=1 Tax=Pseudodesulfovibrio sp. JC047 TaxID=2683199 RepID=UPI0013D2E1B4|nr:hypothetical protein [Pseudodesulfovibrio sp. JC047]NDV20938.1 hypothetical protein [Pseudodesulfovibrio sp. JC047]
MKFSTRKGVGENERFTPIYLIAVGVALLLSAAVAWAIPFFIQQLDEILRVAIKIFPIFIGFSVSMIALVGSLDSTVASFSWEQVQAYQDTFESKMRRQAAICLCYALALGLALILVALGKAHVGYNWLARGFVFVSSFSLLISFTIPISLYKLHCEKYELLLESKGAPRID